jgi:LPXTG-motif cell wall-anchored protein
MIALPSGPLAWTVPTAYVVKIRRGATLRKVTIAILAGLALLLGGAMPAWAETQDGATTETKTAADCAAYVDSENWCEPGEDYNCGDIPEEFWPVQVVDIGNDPFGLDGDESGWGCGDDPEPPVEEPPAEEEPPVDDSGRCAAYADSAAWCADGVEDYDCAEIDAAYKPVELLDAQNDPFHLDDDVDGVGCEGGDEGNEGGSGDGAAAGTGSDGEALPNTGSGDLGPLWLAVLAFLAAGALLVTRRAVSQRQ